jgi:acyl-CoA synthetase (AMP-forming)/AMP-acid ligase II
MSAETKAGSDVLTASPFWCLEGAGDVARIAVVDERGRSWSFQDLGLAVEKAAIYLRSRSDSSFGLLFIRNSLDSLIAYLACLRASLVPLLLPADMAPGLVEALKSHYQPDWQLGPASEALDANGATLAWQALGVSNGAVSQVNPALGILLSTSGSTGSPKLVRLSRDNLAANARSIARYLQLAPGDRALTVLPPYYSYGLSVINSHLQAGATVVLRDVSVLTPAFVEVVRQHAVTSLSGVPYTYQMLVRTGLLKADFPSLNTLTQAGGRLDERLTAQLAFLASEKGWRFFVMYGQTEATARISYVPSERLLEKIGSIGVPIPDGHLEVDSASSELVYRGPNVMLGYAWSRDDLALGDVQNGVLRTGDLAARDDEGFFRIIGRLSRFVKLAGNRIGLDEVEQQLLSQFGIPAMVGGRDERLVVWLEGASEEALGSARAWLTAQYGLHHSLFRLRAVEGLPLLGSGKRDYQALQVDA